MHIASLRQGRLPSHAVAGRLCDFLKARPDVSPAVPPGFLIHLPQNDPADCLSPEPAPEEDDLAKEALLGFGENQSFVIVYDGGPHQESLRRITVRDIALNAAKQPVLNAWCHEREALRAFRIDRIEAIVTEDGDVIAPPARFFAETFAMAETYCGGGFAQGEPLTRIRLIFTAHMMALAHLCHNDSGFSQDEQGIIFDHCLKLAHDADRPATAGEKRTLENFLKTLKPMKLFLGRTMRALQEDRPERLAALLAAADQVINADGLRRHNEISIFGLLRREMAKMN